MYLDILKNNVKESAEKFYQRNDSNNKSAIIKEWLIRNNKFHSFKLHCAVTMSEFFNRYTNRILFVHSVLYRSMRNRER